MDLPQSAILAGFPSAEEIRFELLVRAIDQAVSYQHHDNWYGALYLSVRPSGWWQALLGRTVWRRVWQMSDGPFEGLCVGEDRKLYVWSGDERTPSATVFAISYCTAEDIDRITDILFDMAAPNAW